MSLSDAIMCAARRWVRPIGLACVLLTAVPGWSACGDGVVDPDEQCDLAGANGATGTCCTATCAFAAPATPCRPAASACDVAEVCPGDADACPPDVLAVDGTPCDDANACSWNDRCAAGVCAGTTAVCGDGQKDLCEFCDDGPANGTAASCCSAACGPQPFGAPCSDEGDLCTHDACDEWGTCRHLVEPSPGCSMPDRQRGGSLKIAVGADGATGALAVRWRRGPGVPLAPVGDPGAAPSRLCVYDQTGAGYDLVYGGAASPPQADGVWTVSSAGWRFSSRSGLPEGIKSVTIRQSDQASRSRLSIDARGPLALGPLPLSHRRRVAVQLHGAAGQCWGASFSQIDRNDALRFTARSETGALADANGNGVREWMFVGDSNTQFLSCAYPNLFAAEEPAVVTWNEAIFGTTAKGWLTTGRLAPLLAVHQPDAVVIALGTNDLATRTADQIESDLRALYDQVAAYTLPNGAHPVPYMATVPPIYPRDSSGHDPTIAAVNAAIRQWTPPGKLLDFDSWMPAEWDAAIMWSPGDGIHLGCGGHARRAEVLEVIAHD